MASSGAMADFGRMSMGKKLTLLFVILGIFGFVYYKFFFKKVAEDLKKAKAALVTSKTKNKDIDDKIPKFTALRAKKQLLDASIAEQEKALPTEAEVPAFFETLERKITESGVEIVKWTKRNEESVETFVKVPLDIEFVGTFLQIKRFFASLAEKKALKTSPADVEERERIVSIEGLTIGSPAIRNREFVLTAKFTAVTFRQEDAKPAAPTQPGQVPANSPVPSPASGASGSPTPGGNAPPLPSAGTPAGAKANVEDAIEKNQQKTDKGTTDPSDKRLKGGL